MTRNLTIMAMILGFSLTSYAQSIEITNSIAVGGVTSNSARFWVRTSFPTEVNIELSEDNTFSSSIIGEEITTTSESGSAGIIEVSGLTPNTQYFYRAISQYINDDIERYFWTFPEDGTISNFSFVFGSCQQSGNFLPSSSEEISVFDEIMKHDIKFFLQLGDWGYPDTTDATPFTNNYFAADYSLVQESYRTKFYKDYPMDKLMRRMPIDYVYDDHDYMNNNSSALTSSFYIPIKPFAVYEIENPIGARENSIRGYKENMPGYPLANDSRGIYHKFTFGNTEIFALDLRAQKSPALEPFELDSSTNKWKFNPQAGHTIIGRDESVGEGESQLDWFLNALRNSTADWKFIMSSVPFNIGQKAALDMGIQLQDFIVPIEGAPEGTTAIAASFELADGWSGYPEDSKIILDFIDNNNITNVIVLSGDSHNAAIDDGTNAGLPEIMAGNLDITNSKTITLFESFGLQIWNKGGHGISTEEFNDAFGKVTVFGSDSVKLQLIDEFGTLFADHNVISEKITSVTSEKEIYNFRLTQNYPNPFNPVTKIQYSLASSGHVTLKIYDVLGRKIITLVDKENSAGPHEVFFDASQFASGTYFYALSSGKYFESKKMIYLK